MPWLVLEEGVAAMNDCAAVFKERRQLDRGSRLLVDDLDDIGNRTGEEPIAADAQPVGVFNPYITLGFGHPYRGNDAVLWPILFFSHGSKVAQV